MRGRLGRRAGRSRPPARFRRVLAERLERRALLATWAADTTGWVIDLAANESVGVVQGADPSAYWLRLQGGVWNGGGPQAMLIGGSAGDVEIVADGRALYEFRFRDATSQEALSTVSLRDGVSPPSSNRFEAELSTAAGAISTSTAVAVTGTNVVRGDRADGIELVR
ncbi:MAG: hypothetical protein ACKO38_11030, partial [Planctomycetota bacterium]